MGAGRRPGQRNSTRPPQQPTPLLPSSSSRGLQPAPPAVGPIRPLRQEGGSPTRPSTTVGLRTTHTKGSHHPGTPRKPKRPALHDRPLLGNNRSASDLPRPSKQGPGGPLPTSPGGRGNKPRPATTATRGMELENDAQKGGSS